MALLEGRSYSSFLLWAQLVWKCTLFSFGTSEGMYWIFLLARLCRSWRLGGKGDAKEIKKSGQCLKQHTVGLAVRVHTERVGLNVHSALSTSENGTQTEVQNHPPDGLSLDVVFLVAWRCTSKHWTGEKNIVLDEMIGPLRIFLLYISSFRKVSCFSL